MRGLDAAFRRFEKQIRDVGRQRIEKWCMDLVTTAVKMRLGDPKAHNFTGNLLNSIVVCMYENSSPYKAFYAADDGRVHNAIMPKMTARSRPYSFVKSGDYEGRPSHYTATVETDRGWGIDDAKEFFASFKPDGRNMFDVVVAYPVEYADWVQMQRNTTGYLETLGYAKKTAVKFLQIKTV